MCPCVLMCPGVVPRLCCLGVQRRPCAFWGAGGTHEEVHRQAYVLSCPPGHVACARDDASVHAHIPTRQDCKHQAGMVYQGLLSPAGQAQPPPPAPQTATAQECSAATGSAARYDPISAWCAHAHTHTYMPVLTCMHTHIRTCPCSRACTHTSQLRLRACWARTHSPTPIRPHPRAHLLHLHALCEAELLLLLLLLLPWQSLQEPLPAVGGGGSRAGAWL